MLRSLSQKIDLYSPKLWQQTVRHRGKFNTKYPKPRHDIARFLEEITQPVLIRKIPDRVKTCEEWKSNLEKKFKTKTDTASEFEKFLAKHVEKLFNEHEAVLIVHRHYCSNDLIRRNKIELAKHSTLLWNANTITMKIFIEQNPKYQNILPIVNTGLGRNLYFFVKDKSKMENILKFLRKSPHLVLLAGIVDDTIMTRAGIQDYVNMDNIDTLRAHTVGILTQNLAAGPSSLMSPIQSLCFTLKQITIQAENGSEKKDA